MTEIIGYLAGFLTTFSLLPQVFRIIKTHDTSAISFWTYLLFVVGMGLWLTYGILIKNNIMIIANSVSLILGLCVLLIKIKNSLKA